MKHKNFCRHATATKGSHGFEVDPWVGHWFWSLWLIFWGGGFCHLPGIPFLRESCHSSAWFFWIIRAASFCTSLQTISTCLFKEGKNYHARISNENLMYNSRLSSSRAHAWIVLPFTSSLLWYFHDERQPKQKILTHICPSFSHLSSYRWCCWNMFMINVCRINALERVERTRPSTFCFHVLLTFYWHKNGDQCNCSSLEKFWTAVYSVLPPSRQERI